MAEQWWRETWKEAIYRSDLRPNARLVALIHADFARDKRTSWVHLDDLMHRTGMSRSQALSWRGEVIKAGFLVVLQKSSPGRSPVFGLVIPEGNRSEIPDVNRSEIPDVSQATGPEIDPNGSGNPDEQVRDSGPHQSLINHSSISLSPEQALVRDLLGLDPNDEREMVLIRNTHKLLDQHPGIRSTKAWLRGWNKNELRAELEALSTSSTDDGWGQPEDDDTMPNPGYINGWGTPERVKVEDYYRRQIRALGYTDDEATAYFDQATNVHPTGSKRTRWTEAYMTAQAEARYRDAS